MSPSWPLIEYLRLKSLVALLRILVLLITSLPEFITRKAFVKPSREFFIQSSKDSRRRITLREYLPPQGVTEGQSLPVHINFHGSGFCIPGLLGTDSHFVSQVTTTLNCIVIDADYCKAPEYPFPSPYHDVEDVVAYVLSSRKSYDTSRVTIGGFSSGACLSLAVAACSPIAKDRIRGVVAFYPGCDLREREGRKLNNVFYSCYVPPNQSRTDPRVSPTFMDSSSLPPTFLLNCEYDNLRPDAEGWAERMQGDGAKVTVKLIERVGHGWDLFVYKAGSHEDIAKRQAWAAAINFLQEYQKAMPM